MQILISSVHFLQVNFSYVWDVLLAVLFTMIGAFYARKSMNSREVLRVVRELTDIQEEMYRRATHDWRQSAPREIWMIGLYFERVKTLKLMLDDNEHAGRKIFSLFDQYERTLRAFAKVWAGAERRSDTFWASYQHTFNRYHAIIKILDRDYIVENEDIMKKLSGELRANRQKAKSSTSLPEKKKGRKRAAPAPSGSNVKETSSSKIA